MTNNNATSSPLTEWLDRLQRDSWNLELLISGFSIFLIINLISKLFAYFGNIWLDLMIPRSYIMMVNALMGIVTIGAITLAVNLILHLVLRGFWIGAIGLRSINHEIPFDKLRYARPFAGWLQKKVPPLDNLIQRLDRICSGIFAFAFLVVLMFFSLFLTFLALLIFMFLVTRLTALLPTGLAFVGGIVNITLAAAWMAGGLLYLIDTISLGIFKRRRWTAFWFYPIYQFYGRVSFAFLYRSIYYHLITNYSKRKIQLALSIYLFGFFAFPFVKYEYAVFYPDTAGYTELITNVYDSQRPPGRYILSASIPDRQIHQRFLPLFIRYDVNDNSDIQNHCSGYTPSKKGGLVSGLQFKDGHLRLKDPAVEEKDPLALLGCLSGFYIVKLDTSTLDSLQFYFFEHPQHAQKGITTMIDIGSATVGKHNLQIFRRKNSNTGFKEELLVEIPFWKE